MIYGVSTHLFARETLTSHHLDRIAAAGFDNVELFANSHQIDFDDPAALRDISRAIDRNQLCVNSIHAPFYASLEELLEGNLLDISSTNEHLRALSVSEITRSLVLASYMEVDYYIVHFPGIKNRDALMKSIDELYAVSEQIRTKLCFENVPGLNMGVADIVNFIDENKIPFGVCFDIGHSHLEGRVLRDIEEYGIHFYTAHIHDNNGIHDSHKLPFCGTIPWEEVMEALIKVDYKWGFMMEIKNTEEHPLDTSLNQISSAISKLKAISAKTAP